MTSTYESAGARAQKQAAKAIDLVDGVVSLPFKLLGVGGAGEPDSSQTSEASPPKAEPPAANSSILPKLNSAFKKSPVLPKDVTSGSTDVAKATGVFIADVLGFGRSSSPDLTPAPEVAAESAAVEPAVRPAAEPDLTPAPEVAAEPAEVEPAAGPAAEPPFAHRRPAEGTPCRQIVSPDQYAAADGPMVMTTPISWLHYAPSDYDKLLAEKVDDTRQLFAPWLTDHTPFDVFPTAPSHFRERTRFAIARLPTPESDLCFALFDGGAPSVAVTCFPIASKHINELMPRLLALLNAEPLLGSSLAATHFLGTQSGDMLVSLIYGAPLPPGWSAAAEICRAALGVPSLMGRAKGECVVLGKGNWVEETYHLADGRALTYRQAEGSFSNPSAAMCEHTLNFLGACAEEAAAACMHAAANGNEGTPTKAGKVRPWARLPNLLELYCGNGNHTCALAPRFEKVLCVEIDKKLCDAAEFNLARNGVENAHVLCVSSGSFCKRLQRRLKAQQRAIALGAEAASPAGKSPATPPKEETREAAWLREVQRGQDVILVDPPRSGLDADTRQLVSLYDHILYVSCNPSRLRADLKYLGDAYEVRRFAIFDHFAYSNHLECGAYLRRRKTLTGADTHGADTATLPMGSPPQPRPTLAEALVTMGMPPAEPMSLPASEGEPIESRSSIGRTPPSRFAGSGGAYHGARGGNLATAGSGGAHHGARGGNIFMSR